MMNSTSHSVICHASADSIYAIVSDVRRWVGLFEITCEAVIVGQGENFELSRITALINGVETTWITHRRFLREIHGVDFEIMTPMPLIDYMHGHWRVIELDAQSCLVSVEHKFAIKPDVEGLVEGVSTRQEALDYMLKAIHSNAWRDLDHIKSYVEREEGEEADPLAHSFSAEKIIAAPIADVYALLKNVQNWPDLLPHCQAVDMRYNEGGHQEFVMEVTTPHGNEHFRSIRICDDAAQSIQYFQPEPPDVLTFHSGNWILQATSEGTHVLGTHKVVLAPDAFAKVFGEGSLDEYKQKLAKAIENNSMTTLNACDQRLTGATRNSK